MTDERFWDIIADSRTAFDTTQINGNIDRQEMRLKMLLSNMELEEIIEFSKVLRKLKDKSYRWDLWSVAIIYDDLCSDDSFYGFQNWLISMGEEVFLTALEDVNSLIDVLKRKDVEYPFFENLWYVPFGVYKSKAGAAMPYPPSSVNWAAPVGEKPETGKDLERSFPKIWDAFRSRSKS